VHCQGDRLYFDAAITLGDYGGALREAVLRMKRPHDQPLAMAVADLTVETLTEQLQRWHIDVVLPVPMHWRRRLMRGTNSPDLLAASLARALQVPWSTGTLRRRRYTAPQTSVPPSERFHNVRRAFALTGNVEWDDLHVLLVDDILTTGATCSELARLLKQAGAASVHVAVVCRATGDL
jgi:ComF family protein